MAVSSDIGGAKSPSVEKEVSPQENQPVGPVVAQPTNVSDVTINIKRPSKVGKSKKLSEKKKASEMQPFSPSFHYKGKAITAE